MTGRAQILKTLDATAGVTLCRLVGRVRHAARRPALAPNPDPAAVRRVLAIRPGGMGDMLMLMPLLLRLREARPAIELRVLCERRNAPVLRLAGLERAALLYDAAPFALARRLAADRFDVALDFEQFHCFSAILAWLSGAPVRVGFRLTPPRLHLYTHLVDYDVSGYELDQFARVMGPLRIDLSGCRLHGLLAAPPEMPAALPDAVRAAAASGSLAAVSLAAADPYKHWPVERWRRLIRELRGRGLLPAVVGGRAERPLADAVLAGVPPGSAANLAGRLPIDGTAAVLSRAAVFVGADSGLAHLATALNVPSVVLFGPGDPRKWARPGPAQAVLSTPLPCAPCAIFGYRKWCRSRPCIGSITVESVLRAADGVVCRGAAPRPSAGDNCGVASGAAPRLP